MVLKITKLCFIFSLVLIYACIDPFELTFEDGVTDFLVVDGSFSSEAQTHTLKLYTTKSQIANRRKPVTGAMVNLVAADGRREAYRDLNDGNYELSGTTIQGQVGERYFLEIDLPNGEQYRSKLATMPPKIKGDSAYIKFALLEQALITGEIGRRATLEVFVDSPLPPAEQDYWLKWDVSTLFSFPEVLCGPIPPSPPICYIPGKNDVQETILLNGKNFGGESIQGLKVNEKVLTPSDFEFRGRYYFIVNQQSITKEAYDYWQKINRVANQTGSIFDAPPAGVPGNIYNVNKEEEVVLGFFELQNTDILRAYITAIDFAADYQFSNITCPDSRVTFPSRGDECCNCLQIEKASLDRTEWF